MVMDSLAIQEVLCGHSTLENKEHWERTERTVSRVEWWRKCGRLAPTAASDPWSWRTRCFSVQADAKLTAVP